MEQLAAYNYRDAIEHKRIQHARLFSKIRIKLSRQQLEALRNIIRYQIIGVEPQWIGDKANLYTMLRLYEKVNRVYVRGISTSIRLVFDIVEAYMMSEICAEFLNGCPGDYEEMTLMSVQNQIDKQTI